MSNSSKLLTRPVRTDTVHFAWDPNDSPRLEPLIKDAERARARAEAKPDDLDAAAKAEEAEEAVQALLADIPLISWHLRSIGSKKAERLRDKHPPTAAQNKKHQKDLQAMGERASALQFDPDTFPPALIAACTDLVEVDGDEITDVDDEFVADMIETEGWSAFDTARLFNACEKLTYASSAVDRDRVDRLGNG